MSRISRDIQKRKIWAPPIPTVMRAGVSHGALALLDQEVSDVAVWSITGMVRRRNVSGMEGVRVGARRERTVARFPPLRVASKLDREVEEKNEWKRTKNFHQQQSSMRRCPTPLYRT